MAGGWSTGDGDEDGWGDAVCVAGGWGDQAGMPMGGNPLFHRVGNQQSLKSTVVTRLAFFGAFKRIFFSALFLVSCMSLSVSLLTKQAIILDDVSLNRCRHRSMKDGPVQASPCERYISFR